MPNYNMVASMNESTVVSEYIPESKRSDSYQSEADLEKEFIRMLTEQGYEYLQIHTEAELIANLRKKIEQLNSYNFTDTEWERFFHKYIANANEGIVEKTHTIQEDAVKNMERDDGSTKNITLLDKKNIHNNRLQVINQYEVSQTDDAYPADRQAKFNNRYDVTILVNGFPLIHVELKRRGVAIREAFNQINRYQRDSFWAGSGLYEYVQIFVISNGTHTKYYSNTTRSAHIKEQEKNTNKGKKTSNSFEFTSFWADANNKVISDLVDFTKTFLSKHTILNVLAKYCVFTSEELLLVMRPYQIAATEKILNRIEIATNYKKLGTLEAGGYIWHTTGSGKTLTSFKTAQLASKLDFVDKVLFVVDRKDLDYQTMKEYDRFQKGAANSNTSTAILKKQLEDDNAKIIITTIQKLDHFIRKNKGHEVFGRHIVLVFDECHRSQFGDMHTAITKNFKNYHIFGFTGTPIFADNAGSGKNADLRTTPQAFGDKLHTYTIVDAINDENVLPFRIDYIKTIKQNEASHHKEKEQDRQVSAIDTEKALLESKRIAKIVTYILEHFDQKTKRNRESFDFSKLMNVQEIASSQVKNRDKVEEIKESVRMKGINSIFAVSSIDAAKLYYTEFKRQMDKLPQAAPAGQPHKLRVATIYSYGVNESENDDFVEDENSENTDGLDKSSRDFLEMAIDDYNKIFKTNYDTSSDKFQNYYKDVSLRMKNREIDILIVVNMFLTGFDATTLNTLWVDKNLKYHGLLQAFSRTNRILNSVKTFGNIVCFRNLEEETNNAIALFGDKEAGSVVLLKNFESYYNGYDENGKHFDGYVELIDKLKTLFPLGVPFGGEKAEKEFIMLYGAILRMKNILSTFDNFEGKEILSDRVFQDYQSEYIDLYQKYKSKGNERKENINDDVVFEIELVKQVEINIDYILMLVKKYQQEGNQNKEIVVTIEKAVNSSMNLRSKMELIRNFLSRINAQTEVDGDWKKFVDEQKENDLVVIIEEEKLKMEETHKFIDNSFRDGVLKTTGTDIDVIMPAVSRFGGGNRAEKKKRVIDRLMAYYEKYVELVSMR
ncbi:HsdR family type I site-specific deoxyribonuclease [Lachnospiraceae bacterium A4]|nr:HsdR family type I site-specific deoxyribonuclease [Lachnospiraceae bacterium A4]